MTLREKPVFGAEVPFPHGVRVVVILIKEGNQ